MIFTQFLLGYCHSFLAISRINPAQFLFIIFQSIIYYMVLTTLTRIQSSPYLNAIHYNNTESMELVRQKELQREIVSQFLQAPRNGPTQQRKISKRREVHQQRNVVFQLFKDLICRINEGYSKITLQNNLKSTSMRSYTRGRHKGKRMREMRDVREPRQKNGGNQMRIAERKEDIWSDYAELMEYQVISEKEADNQL